MDVFILDSYSWEREEKTERFSILNLQIAVILIVDIMNINKIVNVDVYSERGEFRVEDLINRVKK